MSGRCTPICDADWHHRYHHGRINGNTSANDGDMTSPTAARRDNVVIDTPGLPPSPRRLVINERQRALTAHTRYGGLCRRNGLTCAAIAITDGAITTLKAWKRSKIATLIDSAALWSQAKYPYCGDDGTAKASGDMPKVTLDGDITKSPSKTAIRHRGATRRHRRG